MPLIIFQTIEKKSHHLSAIYKTITTVAESVFKMLPTVIFVTLLLIGASTSSPVESDEVLIQLQSIVQRIQLEAQALELKSDFTTRKSNLPEVGLTIVSFGYL